MMGCCGRGKTGRSAFPPPAGTVRKAATGGPGLTSGEPPAGVLDPDRNKPTRVKRAGTLRSQSFTLGGELA